MPPLARALLRFVVRTLHRVRRSAWFVTRPSTFGVRAVALTPAGRIVLVKHTYVAGWYLPGGGRKKGETSEQAIIRELREEVGMRRCSSVSAAGGFRHQIDFRDDEVAVFVVRGVDYQPARWSLEIDAVAEFDIDALPADATPRTRADIALALQR